MKTELVSADSPQTYYPFKSDQGRDPLHPKRLRGRRRLREESVATNYHDHVTVIAILVPRCPQHASLALVLGATDHCWLYVTVPSTFCPNAFTPLESTVRVLPSADSLACVV